MAIVLPDGILGNPNMEAVRLWILKNFKLIASVDLPVETFLPQVEFKLHYSSYRKKPRLKNLSILRMKITMCLWLLLSK